MTEQTEVRSMVSKHRVKQDRPIIPQNRIISLNLSPWAWQWSQFSSLFSIGTLECSPPFAEGNASLCFSKQETKGLSIFLASRRLLPPITNPLFAWVLVHFGTVGLDFDSNIRLAWILLSHLLGLSHLKFSPDWSARWFWVCQCYLKKNLVCVLRKSLQVSQSSPIYPIYWCWFWPLRCSRGFWFLCFLKVLI